MSIFDLLFLASAFAAVITLVAAAVAAVQGQSGRALATLKRLGIALLAYIALVLIVAGASPQRVLNPGDKWCFDDWCLSVLSVNQMPGTTGETYTVSVRIFSEAKRVTQRAKGAWMYLIDERGQRYSSIPNPSETPLDVLLQPGESVTASRTFVVPNGVHGLGLITGHGAPYCAMLPPVIGEGGCLFNKPTMIRIQ